MTTNSAAWYICNMDNLYKYIAGHSVRESDDLLWIRRQTHLHTNHARMLSGEVQGALLTLLVRSTGAGRILEIGTFTGYATVCLAKGLPEDGGHIDSLEINDELVGLIREGWKIAGVEDRISLHIGNALDTLSKFAEGSGDDGMYDLVYIDGNKREYCAYYEAVLPLVRQGGIILADNTLWDGKVVEDPLPSDAQTTEILRFNEKVAADPRVECVIIPLRDGLSFIRKK